SSNSTGPYVTVATGVRTNSYTDLAITNGVTYYYVITAANSAGLSPNSNQAAATVPLPKVIAAYNTGNLAISWPATASQVKLYRNSTGPYVTVATSVRTNSYTDLAITNGVTYYYVITAANSAGLSPNSNQAAATVPLPKVIAAYNTGNLAISWPATASQVKLY